MKARKRVRKRRLLIILAGLLVLAMVLLIPIGRRWPDRREARVSVEISTLTTALNSFASKYGRHPPSSVTFYEDAKGWSAHPESRSRIRRLWPSVNLQQNVDLNGDGDTTDVHEFSGAECLVFFLAGLRNRKGEFVGFSKNPVFPFQLESENREWPFFEFDTDRLTDVDKDGWPEFADQLNGMPYLYLFRQHKTFRDADLQIFPEGDSRNMIHAYGPMGDYEDVQLISAGLDGEYGPGGEFHRDEMLLEGARRAERDNITNFSNGRLGK